MAVRAPDAAFADPRLAALYDDLDGDRGDLDAYVAIAAEARARSAIDVGCGTGTLALLLAGRGIDVTGVDPAVASLAVARAKPGAERVTWVEGDAMALLGRGLDVDLAVMTGNVAQVFVDDEDWSATLEAVRACLRRGGWFVLETRRPAARAWDNWDLPPTPVALPDGRTVEVSRQVTDVALPSVSFLADVVVDGHVLRSRSTLRFREQGEVDVDLDRHGFEVKEVREAPDRPGLELVFVSVRR